jgi:hypothetical protein
MTTIDDSNKFTTPPGRIVQGSLYEAQTKNWAGVPLVDKSHQPTQKYYFALAIKKGAEAHWNQTPWGAKVWQYVHAQFANQVPEGFVWKIEDGDDITPKVNPKTRKKEKRNCDREGFPGSWVIRMSSKFAMDLYRFENGKPVSLQQEGFIKCGDYVEVRVNMGINRDQNPSVFLNPTMVCFNSYGIPIVNANFEDVENAGFGAAAIGSVSPVAALSDNQPIVTPTPGAPIIPVVPVTPHPGILQVPSIPQKRMTPKANGVTYEQFISSGSGWTDELLIAQGYMIVG